MSVRVRYLVTTLALVAIGLGYVLMQEWPRHATLHLPAQAEGVARPQMPPPTLPPTAREILERGSNLSLSAEQRHRLLALDRSWQHELTPLEAEVKAAAADFDRFMTESRASGRMSLEGIQSHSAEVRRLSASLREARQRHAEVALQVLTDPQREKVATVPLPHILGGER